MAADVPTAPHAFELFGFDILIDADMRPWLIEVNLSPQLDLDTPTDHVVKTRLVDDIADLLCLQHTRDTPKRASSLSSATHVKRPACKERSSSAVFEQVTPIRGSLTLSKPWRRASGQQAGSMASLDTVHAMSFQPITGASSSALASPLPPIKRDQSTTGRSTCSLGTPQPRTGSWSSASAPAPPPPSKPLLPTGMQGAPSYGSLVRVFPFDDISCALSTSDLRACLAYIRDVRRATPTANALFTSPPS